jgi:hypothetical protein
MELHFAGIRFVQPREDAQKGGFTGPVGTDKADPLPGVDFELHILEQRGSAVSAGNVAAGKEEHALRE